MNDARGARVSNSLPTMFPTVTSECGRVTVDYSLSRLLEGTEGHKSSGLLDRQILNFAEITRLIWAFRVEQKHIILAVVICNFYWY